MQFTRANIDCHIFPFIFPIHLLITISSRNFECHKVPTFECRQKPNSMYPRLDINQEDITNFPHIWKKNWCMYTILGINQIVDVPNLDVTPIAPCELLC